MILGIDLGNFYTKTSRETLFTSKCSRKPNLIYNNSITLDGHTVYIGEGTHDTEYRKIKKQYLRHHFLFALGITSPDPVNKVVVGLPISQYKEDKSELKNMLSSLSGIEFKINSTLKKVNITVEVYPEGVAAVVGTSFRGVFIDIGGRTTDAGFIYDENGMKKVDNPISIPRGTLNLYSDFVSVLNARYGLDMEPLDAELILKEGLRIDGKSADISFAMDTFKQYVEELISMLAVNYKLKTNPVLLIGGGGCTLQSPLMSRIPNAFIHEDAIFANAKGFKRVGELTWQ
ncbi:MAG: ParM/StbA family protein [Clostridia bacterium]|nr:ParM/StbA family protein [Clostridia bacterium]